MNSVIVIVFNLLFTGLVWAEVKGEKVIYSYKKYEKFDLGNLEIQGSVITPGDLSVKERSRKTFERQLMQRLNFNQEIQQDIIKIR